MRLTSKERILLHLLENAQSTDDMEVSPALSQEGVARGAGIEVRHFAQFVRPLIRDDLIQERTAHVVGVRQRRKVYSLTHPGRLFAIRLRESVKVQTAFADDKEEIDREGAAAIVQGTGSKSGIHESIQRVQKAGISTLEDSRRPPESTFVDQTKDAPRIRSFVGRREELAGVLREGGGSRIFVIRGMAGIGKTALAAEVCRLNRGQMNLFWHRIRRWETDETILASLGRFLKSLDRPGLDSVLKRGKGELAAEVLRQDLPDARALIVFDDAHEASPEILGVFRMMADAVVSAPDVKVLILTRRTLPFYDVRDVEIEGLIQEIELGGLEPEDAAALMGDGGDSATLTGLSRRLAGHPLFIELARRHRSDIPRAIHDVRRFMEITIYRELSTAERAVMKGASLYQVPVPRQTLLSIPGSSYEALVMLQDCSLLRFVGGDRYEVHDTIRDFFRSILIPSESQKLGALAVGELRRLAATSFAVGDFVSNINYLSNAIQLSRVSQERAEIWESMGDAEERMGDPPAALVAYREAIRLSKDTESVAGLHRKLATALHVLGDTDSASAEADAASKTLGDKDHAERGWLNLVRSRMSIAMEKWQEGQEQAEAAIRTFQSFQDPRGQAEALVELAVVQINSPSGSPDLAYQYLDEALQLSEPIADPALTASIRVQLANLYAYRLGNANRALDHLSTIEHLPGAMLDVHSRQSLLMLKGWFNLDLRASFEEAEANFNEALSLSKRLHDPVAAAMAKQGAAMAMYHAGEWAVARKQLDEAASELLAHGYAGLSVEALWSAAESALAMGDLKDFSRRAVQLREPRYARGLEVRPVVAHILAGIESLRGGDKEGMRASFMEAIRLAEREVSPQERSFVPFAHDMYGAVLGAMGEKDEASEQDRLAVESAQRFGLHGRLTAGVKIMAGVRESLKKMFASRVPPSAAT